MRLIKPFTIIHLINYAFQYVIDTSAKYNIDESHSLKHSMEVFGYAKRIYDTEIVTNSFLLNQKEIIYMAAIGHDMCDKKYMDEKEGIERYQNYLSEFMKPNDLKIMGNIIETMSYSKVKVNGYPNLGEYQLAFHIVREADLLSAYDIDRCIMYNMYVKNTDYYTSLLYAFDLFDNRINKMISDNLFITETGKKESLKLHDTSKIQVDNLRNL